MVKQVTSHSKVGHMASVGPHGIGVYYFPVKFFLEEWNIATEPLWFSMRNYATPPPLPTRKNINVLPAIIPRVAGAGTGLFVPWRCALSSVCKSPEAIFKNSRRFTIWSVAVFSRWCSRMCWLPIMHNYFHRYRYKGLSWCRPFSELQVPVMNQRYHRICRSPVSHG